MATLIPADGGAPYYIAPINGAAFTVAELHEIVGGYIEVVRGFRFRINDGNDGGADGMLMVINEDGKRLGLPVNRFATALVGSVLRPDDVIVGDAVVCTLIEMGETDDKIDT